MSYFQEMYQATINHDDQKLKELLSAGASINERELSDTFTTVAGKLAAEGKIDLAKHLINKFGAGPEFVVHACLSAGNEIEANALIRQFDIDVKDESFDQLNDGETHFNYVTHTRHNGISGRHIEALAHAGHMKTIHHLLQTSDYNNNITMYVVLLLKHSKETIKEMYIHNLAHGGHISSLEHEFSKGTAFPEYLGFKLLGFERRNGVGGNSMRFVNKKLALHTLSFIQNNTFRFYIVDELTKNGDLSDMSMNEIEEIGQQSQKIYTLMRDFNLGYEQALYCSDKSNLEYAIKITQLMQVYQMKENQAVLWLTDSGFRTWFRRYDQLNDINSVLPPEIIATIDEYLLHDDLKEVNSFLDKIKIIQNEKLKSLSSFNFFKKSSSTPDESTIHHTAENINIAMNVSHL